MKSSASKTSMHTNVSTPANAFSIKASGAAFKVLSDSLYMDKITACIRELTCNAIDAHKEAGNKDPVIITLPNRLNPVFSIQDFGVGMSHDEVLELYTTYFSSSKQESNELIGSFGLGSKSPFAYTDSFTVTAIKDGVKNLYSCTLNDQSFPEVLLVSSTKTTEQNGMKVEFPVRGDDCGSFLSKTAKLLPWFTITPIVKGIGDEELKSAGEGYQWNKDLEGKDWQLGSFGTRDPHGESTYVLMGQILYPVNSRQVSVPSYRRVTILFVPIGAVDIAPSREQLDYSRKTIRYLDDRFKALKSEIETAINLKIASTASPFEKAKTTAELRTRYLREDSKLYEVPLSDTSFKGTFHAERQRSRTVIRMNAYAGNVDPLRTINLAFSFPSIGGVTYSLKSSNEHAWLIRADGDPTFLFTTKKFTSFKFRQQIKEYLLLGPNRNKAIYVFSNFKEFKTIGDPANVITDADLPVIAVTPKEKKPYTGPVSLENRVLKHRYFLPESDRLLSVSTTKVSRTKDHANIDFAGWILVEQLYENKIKEHRILDQSLESIARLLRDCLPNTSKIRIGVASIRQKDVLKKLHEPMFEDWLKKNALLKAGLERILRELSIKKSNEFNMLKDRTSITEMLNIIDDASLEARNLLNELYIAIPNSTSSNYRYYFDSLKETYKKLFKEEFTGTADAEALRKKFFTKYPLLRMIFNGQESYQIARIAKDDKPYIQEYVRLCDSKN